MTVLASSLHKTKAYPLLNAKACSRGLAIGVCFSSLVGTFLEMTPTWWMLSLILTTARHYFCLGSRKAQGSISWTLKIEATLDIDLIYFQQSS